MSVYIINPFTFGVIPSGQELFLSSGSFVVPTNCTSISAICIGMGQVGSSGDGGRGGDLRYSTSITVTPGETLTITIGASGTETSIKRSGTTLLAARGGFSGVSSTIAGNIGGGNGGAGQSEHASGADGGAGGAGGYSGNGGAGGLGSSGATGGVGSNGSGGAGGGGGAGHQSVALRALYRGDAQQRRTAAGLLFRQRDFRIAAQLGRPAFAGARPRTDRRAGAEGLFHDFSAADLVPGRNRSGLDHPAGW